MWWSTDDDSTDCVLSEQDFGNNVAMVQYQVLVDNVHYLNVNVSKDGNVVMDIYLDDTPVELKHTNNYNTLADAEYLKTQLQHRVQTSCEFYNDRIIKIDYYELDDGEFEYYYDTVIGHIALYRLINSYDVYDWFEIITFTAVTVYINDVGV